MAMVLAATLPAPDIGPVSQSPRIVLVFALSADDPDLAAQRTILAHVQAGMAERDLVLTVELGPDAPRSRYGVAPGGFAVLLIGRDGGVKLRSRHPVAAERLFSEIDAMPMRQTEVRHR